MQMFNTDIRCGQCGRKLAAGRYIELIIKCPRCRTLNHLKAESLQSERPGASNKESHHG
ncbi:Com family DNA-binding transcriptional regulator [Chromobacterium violaceum]|uniref:Com family DNA-binding transcriptional regulator n=1 Tax=Chromobacterium violaceum TaxID=536 RepID=UPI003CF8EB77